MKELTQEQKAKAYDEALERAKNLYEQGTITESLSYVFPELKESEDERIRKRIIHALHGDVLDMEETTKAIAWLEKQGDTPKKVTCTQEVEVGNGNIKALVTEEIPTDKVEPKFKVGEWLQYRNAKPFFVKEITKQGYVNGNSCLPFYWENEIHLWTIEDAKKGDILVSVDDDERRPFIYKGCLDPDHPNAPVAYCGIDTEGYFLRGSYNHWWTDENVQPATKEQCNLLFQKMKEAGYEWDAEKKELKKIEDGIEIPFGAYDSELQEVTYYIPKGFHAEMDDEKIVIKKGEKPEVWSEEDEKIIDSSVDNLTELMHRYGEKYGNVGKCIAWLESLKQRIGWRNNNE